MRDWAWTGNTICSEVHNRMVVVSSRTTLGGFLTCSLIMSNFLLGNARARNETCGVNWINREKNVKISSYSNVYLFSLFFFVFHSTAHSFVNVLDEKRRKRRRRRGKRVLGQLNLQPTRSPCACIDVIKFWFCYFFFSNFFPSSKIFRHPVRITTLRISSVLCKSIIIWNDYSVM